MIQSLIFGTLLGISYSVCVKKWTLKSASGQKSVSRGGSILHVFLRLTSIAVLFYVVSKISFLDVSMVLLSFITVITLFLFNLARKAYQPTVKAGGMQSQGR